MIDERRKIIEAVPTSILLLKPDLKLKFEFFDNLNLPRLMHPGADVEEEDDQSSDISYEEHRNPIGYGVPGPIKFSCPRCRHV